MLRHQASGSSDEGLRGRATRSVVRDGGNPIERKAIARVQREVGAMPASLIVQLAIWPDEIAPWARNESTSESLVYNMLARRKPYLRVRERLAERLEVSPAILAHLVDARRPLPAAKRDPSASPGGAAVETAVDWSRPPYPATRDGTNPIERRAVRVVEREVASMPASAVVGLALWPATLAEWSREHRLKSSIVWATLAGSPSERVRAELALRLDVTRRDLDDLIAAARAQPGAIRTEELADGVRPQRMSPADDSLGPRVATATGLVVVDEQETRPGSSPTPPDRDQLGLGF